MALTIGGDRRADNPEDRKQARPPPIAKSEELQELTEETESSQLPDDNESLKALVHSLLRERNHLQRENLREQQKQTSMLVIRASYWK